MGFFQRFKPPPASYLGITPAQLGTDFEEVVRRLLGQLAAQQPIVQDMGKMVICRSPVLVIRDGTVGQPAALIPKPMLARFWTDAGAEVREDPDLVPYVAMGATTLVLEQELAKVGLSDTENIYVSEEAPVARWPDQDKRLRLASLLLADIVRKFAFGFESPEVASSLGLGRKTADEAARLRYQAMKDEEGDWILDAMK